MIVPLVTLAALLLRPSPVVTPLVADATRQWAAVAAVARVSGGTTGPVASAVCIGVRNTDAYLLTAAHVVPPGGAREFEFFTPETYPTSAWSAVGGEVLWSSSAADVALVRVSLGDQLERPGIAPLAEPLMRPKHYPVALWAAGCPGGIAPKCRAEIILGRPLIARAAQEPAFFWQTKTAASGGMSGGPLFDAQGRVIGICAAASGGGGYYTHHDEIVAGLKREGFGWLIPSQ